MPPEEDARAILRLALSHDLARDAFGVQNPGLEGVGVFGSYGRGDAGVGSDLDLLLINAEACGPWLRCPGVHSRRARRTDHLRHGHGPRGPHLLHPAQISSSSSTRAGKWGDPSSRVAAPIRQPCWPSASGPHTSAVRSAGISNQPSRAPLRW
jgi:hypothetical protein